MITGQLALLVASVFAGAAVYISVAEHPARLSLDNRAALAQWKPAYANGALMQASLAIIGFVLGIAAWWELSSFPPPEGYYLVDGRWLWLAGSLALIANWPYTLVCIMPVNKKLGAIAPEDASPASRALLEQWGRLHAGRSVLGTAAALLMLWASVV